MRKKLGLKIGIVMSFLFFFGFTLFAYEIGVSFSNQNFSVSSISPKDGRIYSLKSLQPTPIELLPPNEWLGIFGVNKAGEISEFDLKKFQKIKKGNRVIGIEEILEKDGTQVKFVCKLGNKGFLRILLLLKQIPGVPYSYRLIFLGTPTLFNKGNLDAYPYNEGIVSTGGKKYLKLYPCWGSNWNTKKKFKSPDTIKVSMSVKSGGAGIVYNLQPNGQGYYITLIDNKTIECWKDNGSWVTSGNGLGSASFPFESSKKYTIKIQGDKKGFQVYINNKKLFNITDTQFTKGQLGLVDNWMGNANVYAIKVIERGKIKFTDNFSAYSIGSEGEPNWEPASGWGVPGYISVINGGKEWGGYPARFVSLSDRYIVWGQFDLHHSIIFNNIESNYPWVAISSLPKSRRYTLNLFMKNFPKINFVSRDITRWYTEHMYSSNPFWPKGEPSLKPGGITRHLPEGNTIWSTWNFLPFLESEQTPECLLRTEDRAKSLYFTNIVLLDWYSLQNNPVPSNFSGAWLQLVPGKMYFSKRLRKEIESLHKAGFKVYLYFWPITLAFNPRDKIMLNRYINFIKASVKFYNPDGVGYDMNWNVGRPILKLQYEIYTWLHKKYPGKKVIVDYGYGTPSELYADALLCENTPAAYGFPRNNPVVEATAALRASLMNLIYFETNAMALEKGEKLKQWGWGVNKEVTSLKQEKSIYMRQLLRSLALGSPWMTDESCFVAPQDVQAYGKITGRNPVPFPQLMKLKELAKFSALATGTPWVTNAKSVSSFPDVIASCWANKNRFLVDAYRFRTKWHPNTGFWSPEQEARSVPIWVNINLYTLVKYGLTIPILTKLLPRLKLVVLNKNGLPIIKSSSIKIGSNNLAMKYPTGTQKISSLSHFKIEIENGFLKITGFLQKNQTLLIYPAGEKIK